MTIKKMFQLNRPEDFKGQIELALPVRIEKLYKLLQKTISSFPDDTLTLHQEKLKELSVLIIEFAEDLYCGYGFWLAFEKYNRQFFDTPLPIVMKSGEELNNKFSSMRVLFLLQHVYGIMKPEIIISHSHINLLQLSDIISGFLSNSFTNLSLVSGIGKLLACSNTEAGDVKKKLLWLGTKSYLFRLSFFESVGENFSEENEINIIDDFICAESTRLSGLGVIDILAECLPITEEEISDLRSWYEKHYSAFKVLSRENEQIRALNIVNNQEYTIITGEFTQHFRIDNIVCGSLIPWRGNWFWSGTQHFLPKEAHEEIVKDFYKQPRIIYRYCKDLLDKAVEGNRKQFENFTSFYNSDLSIFSDGQTMPDSEQNRNTLMIKNSLSKREQKNLAKKHNMKGGPPQLEYPDELLAISDGVAVFFKADEGIEIAVHYNVIKSAFLKKGEDYTEEELRSIFGIMESYVISPDFIKRIIKEYGAESLLKAFMIESNEISAVDYLLRKYKGHFYRNRYPSVTVF
ncbi:MAG: DUF3843 family protein [Spirochaetaceae bacterium]|nr:DUF3843 family protein [Spirochaetaceae bacterium]